MDFSPIHKTHSKSNYQKNMSFNQALESIVQNKDRTTNWDQAIEVLKLAPEKRNADQIMECVNQLNQLKFFNDIGEAEPLKFRYNIVQSLRYQRFPAGHQIYDFGQFSKQFYIILQGQTQLFVKNELVNSASSHSHSPSLEKQQNNQAEHIQEEQPQFQLCYNLFEGDYFGCKELLYSAPRQARVMTTEQTQVVSMNQSNFLAYVADFIKKRCPLFGSNSFAQLMPQFMRVMLSYHLKKHEANYGTFIYQQGSLVDQIYFIEVGQVSVIQRVETQEINESNTIPNSRISPCRKEIVISCISSPQSFGDEEIFDDKLVRRFSIRCESPAVVYHSLEIPIFLKRFFYNFGTAQGMTMVKDYLKNQSSWRNENQTSVMETQIKYQQFLIQPPRFNLLCQNFSSIEKHSLSRINDNDGSDLKLKTQPSDMELKRVDEDSITFFEDLQQDTFNDLQNEDKTKQSRGNKHRQISFKQQKEDEQQLQQNGDERSNQRFVTPQSKRMNTEKLNKSELSQMGTINSENLMDDNNDDLQPPYNHSAKLGDLLRSIQRPQITNISPSPQLNQEISSKDQMRFSGDFNKGLKYQLKQTYIPHQRADYSFTIDQASDFRKRQQMANNTILLQQMKNINDEMNQSQSFYVKPSAPSPYDKRVETEPSENLQGASSTLLSQKFITQYVKYNYHSMANNGLNKTFHATTNNPRILSQNKEKRSKRDQNFSIDITDHQRLNNISITNPNHENSFVGTLNSKTQTNTINYLNQEKLDNKIQTDLNFFSHRISGMMQGSNSKHQTIRAGFNSMLPVQSKGSDRDYNKPQKNFKLSKAEDNQFVMKTEPNEVLETRELQQTDQTKTKTEILHDMKHRRREIELVIGKQLDIFDIKEKILQFKNGTKNNLKLDCMGLGEPDVKFENLKHQLQEQKRKLLMDAQEIQQIRDFKPKQIYQKSQKILVNMVDEHFKQKDNFNLISKFNNLSFNQERDQSGGRVQTEGNSEIGLKNYYQILQGQAGSQSIQKNFHENYFKPGNEPQPPNHLSFSMALV